MFVDHHTCTRKQTNKQKRMHYTHIGGTEGWFGCCRGIDIVYTCIPAGMECDSLCCFCVRDSTLVYVTCSR